MDKEVKARGHTLMDQTRYTSYWAWRKLNFLHGTSPSLSDPLTPPQDGLVKANMEKLTFYALSAPEKLDRIGAYLSERLSRDVARHRYGSVSTVRLSRTRHLTHFCPDKCSLHVSSIIHSPPNMNLID